MKREIWKDIIGYEGHYKISSLAIIVSTKNNKTIIRKQPIDNRGYHTVGLCLNGVQKKYTTHRILAKVFIPNPENHPDVNHKNGIRTDNRLENLEWVSRRENVTHGNLRAGKGKNTVGTLFYPQRAINGKGWKSTIFFNKKSVHLGFYKTQQEAHGAYLNYINKNGLSNKYIQ